MQLVILVYHWSGASRDLTIYMIIRVLVSSYLFLNGFGHLSYHWKQHQEDFNSCKILTSSSSIPTGGIQRVIGVSFFVFKPRTYSTIDPRWRN